MVAQLLATHRWAPAPCSRGSRSSPAVLLAAQQQQEQQRQQQRQPVQRRELLLGAVAAALGASALRPQPAAAAEDLVPKAYEKTATKLVAALREAISTDLSDAEEREVRRAADPAKSLVREFLTRWRGAGPAVEGSESYAQLTSAIQQLGAFYQANGQRTRLTPEAGRAILDTLDAAEAALPAQAETRSLLPGLF